MLSYSTRCGVPIDEGCTTYLFDIISIFLHKNNLLSLIVKNGKRLLS